MLDDDKARFWAWYNEHIVPGWYRSSALIGGWLTSLIILIPDILQFVVDHYDTVSGMVIPTVPVFWKAVILFVYVNVLAPPLRAWAQKKMQAAVLKQATEKGLVVPTLGGLREIRKATDPTSEDPQP